MGEAESGLNVGVPLASAIRRRETSGRGGADDVVNGGTPSKLCGAHAVAMHIKDKSKAAIPSRRPLVAGARAVRTEHFRSRV